MARIRTVKPEFFKNFKLYSAEKECNLPLRLAFEGLWCESDRDGRFRWVPQELKLGILPFDDVDFSAVLESLIRGDWIRKYELDGKLYGYIPAWHEHQVINNREQRSVLPEPPTGAPPVEDASATRAPRVPHAPSGEGKGREGKGKERKDASPDAPPLVLTPPGKVNGHGKGVKSLGPVNFNRYIEACTAAHVEPIPADDPIFTYADKIKIPRDFLELAWKEFERKHRTKYQKVYSDWPKAFRNCVQDEWYHIWRVEADGNVVLTPHGRQVQRAHKK